MKMHGPTTMKTEIEKLLAGGIEMNAEAIFDQIRKTHSVTLANIKGSLGNMRKRGFLAINQVSKYDYRYYLCLTNVYRAPVIETEIEIPAELKDKHLDPMNWSMAYLLGAGAFVAEQLGAV